jgi:hypothetical protein
MITAIILLILVALFVPMLRRLVITGVVLMFLLSWAYIELTTRVQRFQQGVSASVDSALSAPGRALSGAKDKFLEWLAGKVGGEGWDIVKPLMGAAAENTERYEYCLADIAFMNDGNPAQCESFSGQERTQCFEREVDRLNSVYGIADRSQIDMLRASAKNGCRSTFLVNNAMKTLLTAGVQSLGVLYRYCEAPGACKEPELDTDEYVQCLYQRFTSPRPLVLTPKLSGGVGLRTMYCSAYTHDPKRWRKCTEVALIEQTAGQNLGLALADNPGLQAIGACQKMPI